MSTVVKKYIIPLLISFVGFWMIFDYYLQIPGFNEAAATTRTLISAMTNFAVFIGVGGTILSHTKIIMNKRENWPYSILLLIVVIVSGFFGSISLSHPTFKWIYDYMFVPANSTIFSFLAFYIASAAIRAFKARNLDSAVLLAAGFGGLLGFMPVSGAFWEGFPLIADWLAKVPTTASMQGITIGMALGVAGITIRTLLARGAIIQFLRGGGQD